MQVYLFVRCISSNRTLTNGTKVKGGDTAISLILMKVTTSAFNYTHVAALFKCSWLDIRL